MRLSSGILLLALTLNAQHPFFYNRPSGLDLLTAGMKNDHPIAIDWDEDGRTDILQRNIYSTALDAAAVLCRQSREVGPRPVSLLTMSKVLLEERQASIGRRQIR